MRVEIEAFGMVDGEDGAAWVRILMSISVAARSDVIDVENFVSVFLTGLDDGSVNSGAEPEPTGELS
jgi:hypothetical protein